MSKENVSPKETSEEAEKWYLPFNIGIEKMDVLVKAFFQAGADSHTVSSSDLGERTGIHPRTLKPNIRFLLAIGVLETKKGEKDSYLLTEKGSAYAKALSLGDTSQCSTILQEILESSYLKGLVDFAKIREDLTFDLLFSHIKTMARLREDEKYPRGVSAPFRAGIYTLIALLSRANIIPSEIKPQKEAVRVRRPARRKPSVEPVPQVISKIETKPTQFSATAPGKTLPFTINISVEARDSESIKQLINLIRELRGKTVEQES